MLGLLLIQFSLFNSLYTEESADQGLFLNFEPDVVMIDPETSLISYNISCFVFGQTVPDLNTLKLTYLNDSSFLMIDNSSDLFLPKISKSGIFEYADLSETYGLYAYMEDEPFLFAHFENVSYGGHLGTYICEATGKSTVDGNDTVVRNRKYTFLPAFKKPQISLEAVNITQHGTMKIGCSMDSPCLHENTVQFFKDESLYVEIDNNFGGDVDYLCQSSATQAEGDYYVTVSDLGRDISFYCKVKYTLPSGRTIDLTSDVRTTFIDPTYDKPCMSSNNCLLHEVCLLDFCDNSKCTCDAKRFYDGRSCVPKQKFGEECKSCDECSTWLSVCEERQGKQFPVCTCRHGYFYDESTDSCTNVEPCPKDNSYIYSRKENVCYSINKLCDNCTNWDDSCPSYFTSPLRFIGNARGHIIDRMWSYGLYSNSKASLQGLNDEKVMLLLSTTFKYPDVARYDNVKWYWPDGGEILNVNIDDTDWNAAADEATSTGCLYMLYDSCNSVVKSSKHCPYEKFYRGCIINLGKVFCNKNIDERNTTWPLTEGGTLLERPCPTGYSGTVTRKCTKYGQYLQPFYNCTSALFKNVSDMLENGNVDVPEALAVVSSEIEQTNETYIGDLIEIQNILGTVTTLSNNETISENTTQDYLATASFLLDDEKNGKEWKSRIEKDGKGAEDILPHVETFAQKVAESLLKNNKSSLKLAKPNIVLQYSAISTNESEVEDIAFPNDLESNAEWNGTKTLSLSLDVAAFSDQGVKAFTGLLYKNLSQSVPKTLQGKSNTTKIDINSQVVSFQLLPKAPKLLDPELEIVFHGFEDMTGKVQHCSFLSEGEDGAGLWSTKGCRKVVGNGTTVKCKCNHLTNFALLISTYKAPEKHASILGIITIVGCSISGVLILITLAAHIAYWRFMKSDKTILISCLCVMFLICYVFFLAGVSQTSNKTACTAIAVTLHYIFLVLFFLMLAEGATIFITVTFPFHKKSHLKELLITAFVAPLIIVVATAGGSQFEGYGNENNCWLSPGSWIFWMFAGPAALVILANFITIGLFFRRLFGTKASHLKSMKEKAKMTAVAIGVLTPVMGITWVFGFLSVNEETLWLQYMFCLFNSLQGVLIFLFHCVGNKQLRQAMKVKKERKRTVDDFNSELKEKIRKKFPRHLFTTTESSMSGTEITSDGSSVHHSKDHHTKAHYTKKTRHLFGNKQSTSDVVLRSYVLKSDQSPLMGKQSEIVTGHNDDKRKHGDFTPSKERDAQQKEDFSDIKTDDNEIQNSCLKHESITENNKSEDLISERKPLQPSGDCGQSLTTDMPGTDSYDTIALVNVSINTNQATHVDEERHDVICQYATLHPTPVNVSSTQDGEQEEDTTEDKSHKGDELPTDETTLPGEYVTGTFSENDPVSGPEDICSKLPNNTDEDKTIFDDGKPTAHVDDEGEDEDITSMPVEKVTLFTTDKDVLVPNKDKDSDDTIQLLDSDMMQNNDES